MVRLQDIFEQLLSFGPRTKAEIIEGAYKQTKVKKEKIEGRLNKILEFNPKYKEHQGRVYYGKYADDLKVDKKTYQQLMELIHRDKYALKGVTTKGFKVKEPNIFESYSIYKLEKDNQELEVRLDDDASLDFAAHHHYLPDNLDGKTYCKIINKAKYYEDIEHIAKDFDSKINGAILKVKTGKSKVCFTTEYDELLEEFFLTPNALFNKKFLPLKELYHEIYAKTLLESQNYLKIYQDAKKSGLVEKYSTMLDSLGSSFFNADGPMKNYRAFKEHVTTSVKRFSEKAMQQTEYIDYLFKGATAVSPVPIRVGFLQILDAYRRFAELLRNPIRDIRKIIQFKHKEKIDLNDLNYDDDIEIIRKDSKFKDLIQAIHPIVRHSESHLFTRIDEDKKIIYIQDDKAGKKFEFNPRDIHDKRAEIQSGLVPALLAFYAGTDIALKLLGMRSASFLHRIVLLGNTKK
ncbi:MAG: hypothetical protein ABIH53_00370 [archaeon]